MEIEIVIDFLYSSGYYIILKEKKEGWDDWDISQDASIAEELKISLEEYHQSLCNYNAHSEMIGKFREEYYFKNKSDAEKACEWIYSVIIANKLID